MKQRLDTVADRGERGAWEERARRLDLAAHETGPAGLGRGGGAEQDRA